MFESGHKKSEKRKKVKGGDAEEIDSFLGPWAKYADEKDVAKPSEVIHFYNYTTKITCLRLSHKINQLTAYFACEILFYRRSRKNWMRSQQRDKRREEMRKRLQERKRPFFMVLWPVLIETFE